MFLEQNRFVASQTEDENKTGIYANIIFKSFEMTLPFKNYRVLDHRTKDQAQDLIKNADFIYLCGGHVPSQLALFEQLNLRELIKNTNAVICGGSAGSMDSADIVYCPPPFENYTHPSKKSRVRIFHLKSFEIYLYYVTIRKKSVEIEVILTRFNSK